MNDNPGVGIFIPSYNHRKYLPDLIESIISQSYPNISVIVSDDCSTDDSLQFLNHYVTKDRRFKNEQRFIKVIPQPRNLGPVRNCLMLREEMTLRPSLEFVTCIESDDYLHQDSIAKRVEFLQKNKKFVAVHSNACEVFEDGKQSPDFWGRNRKLQVQDGQIPQGWIRKDLEMSNFILTCTFMARREQYLQHFDLERFISLGIPFIDYPFFLSVARQGQIGYIPEQLSYYRNLSTSLSHAPENRTMMVQGTQLIQQYARAGAF